MFVTNNTAALRNVDTSEQCWLKAAPHDPVVAGFDWRLTRRRSESRTWDIYLKVNAIAKMKIYRLRLPPDQFLLFAQELRDSPLQSRDPG